MNKLMLAMIILVLSAALLTGCNPRRSNAIIGGAVIGGLAAYVISEHPGDRRSYYHHRHEPQRRYWNRSYRNYGYHRRSR